MSLAVGTVHKYLHRMTGQAVFQLAAHHHAVHWIGDQIHHKAFGEGIVEAADEKTKMYYIRFINGTKPINFGYNGLSHIF